jgi:hypothetical protein
MNVHTRPHRRSANARSGLRAQQRVSLAQAQPLHMQPSPQARERDAGGPQDCAAYACACGYAFEAAVSTTVACPSCGAAQAW